MEGRMKLYYVGVFWGPQNDAMFEGFSDPEGSLNDFTRKLTLRNRLWVVPLSIHQKLTAIHFASFC